MRKSSTTLKKLKHLLKIEKEFKPIHRKNGISTRDVFTDAEYDLESKEIPDLRTKAIKIEIDDDILEIIDTLMTDFEVYNISVIELAIYNSFLAECMSKEIDGFKTISYGELKDLETIKYGGNFKSHHPWFFNVSYNDKNYKNNTILFQTRIFRDNNNNVCCSLSVSFKNPLSHKNSDEIYETFQKVAFNNSEYKGKCLEVSIHEGNFNGIEIIPTDDFNVNLILTETQNRFLDHFVKRILRGKQARYLLSGEPGTGKTLSIRKIIQQLVPKATFIIPIFSQSTDLKTILESCEIFQPGIIVIDDLDIYLGNRENGSSTRLLADFLSYFDGIKKRKISILASTNDKKLLDKAAERPGRFNITLDFSYLEDENIDKVIDMHLPKKWRKKEVYDSLKGVDKQGKKIKVTGAFIANLAENIVEMSTDEKNWSLEDTLTLIKDSYVGFYLSQINREKRIGFNND